jgi:hypothetical protein
MSSKDALENRSKGKPLMPNTTRKSSNYEYEVPLRQLDALILIALKKDCDIQALIWDALDEYIQREEPTWKK